MINILCAGSSKHTVIGCCHDKKKCLNLEIDSESSCHEAMLTNAGAGFPEALDSPGMCTLLLSSTLHPKKVSQMPFCSSLKVSRPAARAPAHALSASAAAPVCNLPTAKGHLPKSSVQVVPTRKIPYNPSCIQFLPVRAEI